MFECRSIMEIRSANDLEAHTRGGRLALEHYKCSAGDGSCILNAAYTPKTQ